LIDLENHKKEEVDLKKIKIKVMKKRWLYVYDPKRMNYVRAYKVYTKIIGGIILAVISGFGYATYSHTQKLNSIEYITEETRTLIINEENKFSEERLKQFLLELNIRFPHIVLAQAKLESGSFKSKMFRENNNFFGMKVARRRPTTNKGEQYGHAFFDSWRDCVLDYAFYQAAYLSDIKTESQYFAYLGANYAEDPTYVEKLKKIIKK
jgi:uncharacterized FlgJ-related protein